jgi:CDP-glucose 4,6-dehydratase
LLALETAKTRTLLSVQPRWDLPQAVGRTMAWYRAQHAGTEARVLCDTDIAHFEAQA